MTEGEYRASKVVAMAFTLIAICVLVTHTIAMEKQIITSTHLTEQNVGIIADALQRALNRLGDIETNTTRTEAEMAGLLNQTRHSMMTPAQTKELVDRAANLMDNANLSVIRLGEAADSLRGIGPTAQGAIAQAAQDVHQSAQQTTAMMKAATDDLADPALKDLAQHADATATNVEATSADVKKVADEWAAPVKGLWNHIKVFLFEAAGPLASIATAFK